MHKDPDRRRAYMNARYAAHPELWRDYRRTPRGRALRFLSNNPDCTSTAEEVEEIYAAAIDVTTGLPGTLGRGRCDLQLDHIPGGPAIGLVPHWLNLIMSDEANRNWEKVVAYREARVAHEQNR